jgi:hypothetical protein
LTQGDAGKGNAVLNIGPGRLSMENSDMPLHPERRGEAKRSHSLRQIAGKTDRQPV